MLGVVTYHEADIYSIQSEPVISFAGVDREVGASKHKAMSYPRMKEEKKGLFEMARSLTGEAQSVDAQEDGGQMSSSKSVG